ncbi:hypothetical protein MJD09_04065, partial [bacterium]|nr:hypothetical protein [bacterium]
GAIIRVAALVILSVEFPKREMETSCAKISSVGQEIPRTRGFAGAVGLLHFALRMTAFFLAYMDNMKTQARKLFEIERH